MGMFDEMRNPICWMRGLWYSLRYGVNISGHHYLETENKGNRQVLKCKTCGYESVGYFW